MSIFLEDGQGSGMKVGVNSENRLITESISQELQHHYSVDEGEVYQTIGRETAVTNTTQTILHIANDDTSRLFAVTYIRLQLTDAVNGTDSGTYFQLGFGRTYASDGSAVVPVNMNTAVGNTANLTCYDDSPTMAGTFTEIDAWYPNGETMQLFNKHGSLLLGYNNTLEVRLVTDHTIGVAYARITGMFLHG